MKLTKLNVDVRCDVGICRHRADYTLETGGTMLRRRLNICEDCMRQLYEELGKVLVPRSPENKFKKVDKRG